MIDLECIVLGQVIDHTEREAKCESLLMCLGGIVNS